MEKKRVPSYGNFEEGENHLLVIGINKYPEGFRDLSNAVPDAQAFSKILCEKYGFKSENILALFNESAGRQEIINAFEEFRLKTQANDNLVFYYSGQGEFEKEGLLGYWIPADAEPGNRSTYLSDKEVVDLVSKLQARHVLGIVDSCFSDSLLTGRRPEVGLQGSFNNPSRWLMTSGLEAILPEELPKHRSSFSAVLLDRLEANTRDAWGVSGLWEGMQGALETNPGQNPCCAPLRDDNHQGGEFFFLKDGIAVSGDPPQGEVEKEVLTYADRHGNEVLLEIEALEREGLQRQAGLLIKKLGMIREALILESDPLRKFKYEHQIEELEKQLADLKERL